MIGLASFVLVLCTCSTNALFFRRADPVANAQERPIEESCLALADQGNCSFYTCFENRLPCGREWYIVKSGQYYCNKIQRHRSSFSPEGQRFLDNARKCLTQSLKDMYRRDYVDCHDLEHHAIAAITPCFVDNGFCNVFQGDASHFFDVYEFSDLFTRGAAKIWRAIVSLASQCGSGVLRGLTSNTGNFLGALTERLGK